MSELPQSEESQSPFDLIDTTPQSRYGSSPTLGDIRQVLTVDRKNLVAGMIFGILSFLAAVVLCYMAYELFSSPNSIAQSYQTRTLIAVTFLIVAMICIAGTFVFVTQSRSQWNLRIIIGDRGFARSNNLASDEEFLWDDLVAVRQWTYENHSTQRLSGSLAANRGLQMFEDMVSQQSRARTERRYELHFRGNRRVQIDRNLLIGHDVLGDLAIIEAERRGITPARAEYGVWMESKA